MKAHSSDYFSDDDEEDHRRERRLPCPWFFRLLQPYDYGSVDEMRKPLYYIVDDVSSHQVQEFEDSKQEHKTQIQHKPSSTVRPSLSSLCIGSNSFGLWRRQTNRRRHDSETASLTRVESMLNEDHPIAISPQAKLPKKDTQALRKRAAKGLNRRIERLRRLRLPTVGSLSCRKPKELYNDEDNSSTSEQEFQAVNNHTSILGVAFPHPVFELNSRQDERKEGLQQIEKKFAIPVQHSTNKLNLTNTIVETTAADSWGSETSSYPSDEESIGEDTWGFDDEAPFDEVDVSSSFGEKNERAPASRRLIEIGDTDQGVHYFYNDSDGYDIDSLPWIERRESTGTLEFRPDELYNVRDVNAKVQKNRFY